MVSLHFTTAQYGGIEADDFMTPFIVVTDFVEESEVNGTQMSVLGMFTPSVIKQNIKKAFHKKQYVEFSEEFHPRVINRYISRIRIRILDRNLSAPTTDSKDIFIFGTTCKLLFIRDGRS